MHNLVRRVIAPLRRHLLLICGALFLLAVVVVWWIFSAPIAPWLHSAQSVDVVTLLQQHLLAAGMIGSCLLILVLIGLPKWQASRVQDVKDRLTVENAARQTLAQIIGGAVLIAGLFFTWANLKITQETATKNQEITREGQITDRFTKAIAQLGEQGPEKLAVRLGGIYALERIARDSEKDHWPIIEVLTAYIREHAPWRPEPPKDAPLEQDNPSPKRALVAAERQPLPKLATDIQAVLTVLGRRDRTSEKEDQRLDLRETDLRNAALRGTHLEGARLWNTDLEWADLRDAHLKEADFDGAHLARVHLLNANLERANFLRAHLEEANLNGANLKWADLRGTHLEGAALRDAHLEEANLEGAYLERAGLRDAHLEGANLSGTHLKWANLRGAYLEGARNLVVEQLCIVRTLYKAQLDPPLAEQIRQQCPQLLEEVK